MGNSALRISRILLAASSKCSSGEESIAEARRNCAMVETDSGRRAESWLVSGGWVGRRHALRASYEGE